MWDKARYLCSRLTEVRLLTSLYSTVWEILTPKSLKLPVKVTKVIDNGDTWYNKHDVLWTVRSNQPRVICHVSTGTFSGVARFLRGPGSVVTWGPSLSSTLPSAPLPWEVGPPIAARRSGGALKLPQRVRTKPGRQTLSGAFQHIWRHFFANIFMSSVLCKITFPCCKWCKISYYSHT